MWYVVIEQRSLLLCTVKATLEKKKAKQAVETWLFCKKKAKTSNGVVQFNEDSNKQMKMIPNCFAKRNGCVLFNEDTKPTRVKLWNKICYKERTVVSFLLDKS